MVKYWPAKGKSGFIVWRFMLRRDDPSPAPWTEEGQQRMEEGGYGHVIYPDNYLELQAQKEKEKRKRGSDSEEEEEDDEEEKPAGKKRKTCFKISSDWLEVIEKDTENKMIWDQVVEREVKNKKELTDYIEDLFKCIICQVSF